MVVSTTRIFLLLLLALAALGELVEGEDKSYCNVQKGPNAALQQHACALKYRLSENCVVVQFVNDENRWEFGCHHTVEPTIADYLAAMEPKRNLNALCKRVRQFHRHDKHPWKMVDHVSCADVDAHESTVRVCCAHGNVTLNSIKNYYAYLKENNIQPLNYVEKKDEVVEDDDESETPVPQPADAPEPSSSSSPPQTEDESTATGSDGQSTNNGSDFRTSPKPSHKEDPDKTSVWIGISVLLVVVIVVVIAVVAIVATRKKRKMHKKTKKGKKDKKKKREEASATETGTSASRIDKSTKGPSSNMSTVGTPSKKSSMKSTADTPTSKI